MEHIHIIKLSSGKKIELTQEEHDELKNGLGETIGVPYLVYPMEYPQPYLPRPWEPGIVWCGDSGMKPQ